MTPQDRAIVRDGLTAEQIAFAVWLVQSGTIARACKASKVSRTTANRWLIQPEFIAEYGRVAETARLMALKQMEGAVAIVSEFLVDTVQDDAQEMDHRLKAAKMVLDAIMGASEDAARRAHAHENPGVDLVRRPADVLPLKVASG